MTKPPERTIKKLTQELYERLGCAGAPRAKTAKLLEQIDLAADQMMAYTKELEDEIEDYHPADLQPVVTRDQIIVSCRERAGLA